MKTKEGFLKSLTNAEQLKLRILYDQLQDVWNQNKTEQLLEILNQKYQELKETPRITEYLTNNFEINMKNELKDYETRFEAELKQDITSEELELKQKSKILKMKKENLADNVMRRNSNMKQILKSLEQELNTQQLNFIEKEENQLQLDTELWENNILGKLEKLKQKQNNQNEISEKFQLKVTQLIDILKAKATLFAEIEEKSMKLKIAKEEYERLLNWNRKINSDLRIKLEKMKSESETNLMRIEENLSQNFKNYEKTLLMQLGQELIQEMDLPLTSKNYLKNCLEFPISLRIKNLKQDKEKRKKAYKWGLQKLA